MDESEKLGNGGIKSHNGLVRGETSSL